tara:strand:- start:404 stop:583 length:180 start_codon:yes stop_codon:yes gene_type:complete
MLAVKRLKREWHMNMLAGLIGFSAFVLTLTLLGLVGYWKADQVEAWAKKRFSKRNDSHG